MGGEGGTKGKTGESRGGEREEKRGKIWESQGGEERTKKKMLGTTGKGTTMKHRELDFVIIRERAWRH
jgi:hypothetical protein